MVRSIVLSLALVTPPSWGLWITAAGDTIQKPCPTSLEMSDKARLPQGCVAHVPGVWLSRQTFKEGELERTRLKEELLTSRAREAVLQQRISNLEMQVKITGVETVCPPCRCYGETVIAATVAAGGCMIWTLSR